ncbi:MAG: YdeI/OmpD-associated family protein [Bacteroidia bacterium]|nr:YdeI/OmpD-associated family protein [Bacteroidia bacterium]MBT8288150.1 YdeI/OmpD-associated family protein [Bacteroidia bacterium]NNK72308.1 hypothetical protein [Flavobacteriaceae bacterium]
MEKVNSVEEYIESHDKFKEGLEILRKLMIATEMEETIKWSIPTYSINGKNVCGIGAFKNHFGIWFFNGVFLKDEHNLLRNAQDGKTKAMRQMIFNTHNDIQVDKVRQYLKEAIANQKAGLEVKPDRRKKETILPLELKEMFEQNKKIKEAFSKLTGYKQREYCEYIGSARRDATKASRLVKILPMIEQGIGLNDKYKNC